MSNALSSRARLRLVVIVAGIAVGFFSWFGMWGTIYRDTLGFTWDFGDDTYAVVWRDNSAIHFVQDEGKPNGIHLFQWVRDVDAYYGEIRGRGAVVASEPTDRPYGIREFGVQDLNGVGIIFGQDIEHD